MRQSWSSNNGTRIITTVALYAGLLVLACMVTTILLYLFVGPSN